MSIDLLILNTAVADFRGNEFSFVEKLVGLGGLAKCGTEDMPTYSQQQLKQFIDSGKVTAGGPGNTAPLAARAGLKVAAGVNLGKGEFDGLDIQGRFFYDTMEANGVDMSATYVHPELPTGTTFIYDKDAAERGGLAYFPNSNNDFDFEYYKKQIERLCPSVVYYMYSGLSDRGDANGGKDLGQFIKWCRQKGIVTIVDSHTLSGNPQQMIESNESVAEYDLLEPLLSELDIFFTSYDEARMIENTLGEKGKSEDMTEKEYIRHFLDFLAERFWDTDSGTRMFGVTVSNGAYEKHKSAKDVISEPQKVGSHFMAGEVIDLVGAGDSFRAGMITYVAKNIDSFKNGTMDFGRAIQMGNLFASLYIKAPIDDRYGNICSYDRMLKTVQSGVEYENYEQLISIVKQTGNEVE